MHFGVAKVSVHLHLGRLCTNMQLILNMLKGLNGSLYVAQLGATVVALPPDSGTRRTNFIWNTILGRLVLLV